MEKWEKELRAKLEKELPDGIYDVSSPPLLEVEKANGQRRLIMYTGKGGKIDMEVAWEKELRKLKREFKPPEPSYLNEMISADYGELTEEKLLEAIKTLFPEYK